MDRFTEYHCGVAVIKDKNQLSGAMTKLAKIEDMKELPEVVCDNYCKHPCECKNQEELDEKCADCRLAELFEILS